ncbi:MAG: hypothetical protein ACI39U_08655, partial [Candidatus Cryptobacteroides sp.]
GDTPSVRRIFVSGRNSAKLAGSGTIDLSAENPAFVGNDSNTNNWFLTGKVDDGKRFNLTETASVVYFAIPSGTYDNLSIEFLGNDGTADVDVAVFSSKSHTLQTGHVLPLNVDMTLPVEYTDLSADSKYANCYMIESTDEKYYAFDAKTPSGKLIATFGTANSMSAITTPFSASLLWQTADAPVGGVKFDKMNQKVYFRTEAGKKGNAVIAANKRSGDVVWSWHIWIPGETVNTIKVHNGNTDEDYYYMDRNLGATSALKSDGAATWGLLYQWGRKDPFTGADKVGSSTPVATLPEDVISIVENGASVGTVQYAIQHPTQVIKGSTNAGTNNDWLYAAHDNGLWGADKTEYDPCPNGYMVWAQKQSYALRTNKDSYVPTKEWDSVNLGYNFSLSLTGYDYELFLPACGSRKSGDCTINADQSGDRAYYWTYANGTTNDSQKTSKIALLCGASNAPIDSHVARSQSNPVRCVKQ